MFWKPWTLLLQSPGNNWKVYCPLDLVFCRQTSQELTSEDKLCSKERTSLVFVAVCHTSLSFPSSLFVSEQSAPLLSWGNKLKDSWPAEDRYISWCMCWVVFVNGAYLASVWYTNSALTAWGTVQGTIIWPKHTQSCRRTSKPQLLMLSVT